MPRPELTILDLMDGPFARWFRGDSWLAWRAALAILFRLHDRLDAAGISIYQAATGRTTLPAAPFRVAWLCVGRRGGKSIVAALVAVYLAFFRDYEPFLGPGEMGTIMLVAADRKQARTVMRYVRGFIAEVPVLAAMITGQTKESLTFSNRVVIEVATASFRTVRGYTLVAVINDEICFWNTDTDAADPDKEIIAAQLPAMATIPSALMLNISSPHARRGCMWEAYREHWGKDGSPILFWKAASRCLPEETKCT